MSDKFSPAYKYYGKEYDPVRRFISSYYVECTKAKVLLTDLVFVKTFKIREGDKTMEYHEYAHPLGIRFFVDDGGEPYKMENNNFVGCTGADVVCAIHTARENYKKSIAPLKAYLSKKNKPNDERPLLVKDFIFLTSKPATDSTTFHPVEIYFYKSLVSGETIQVNEKGTEFIYSGNGDAKRVNPIGNGVYQYQ